MKKLNLFLLALGLILASSASLMAATATWDGDTDTYWTTGGNWSTSPNPPATGDNILFPDVSGQTVDLFFGAYTIGTLTFNAADAYSLGNGLPGLTLGGGFSQNGAGSVALNVDIDLGGASRVFGGSGSGVVTFNNPITDSAFTTSYMIVGAGNYVIANANNSVYGVIITNGAQVKVQGTDPMPAYPNPSYLGGDYTSGGGWVQVDAGTLNYAQYGTDTIGTNSASFIGDWNGHGIDFGPNGGTLLLNQNYSVDQGPTFYRSSATNGTPGTIVAGWPPPFTGTGRGGTNFAGPWDVPVYGLCLGPNSGLVGADYARRQGEGDLTVTLTNGAMAYLEWSMMTNGFLILKGQPGGNSAVADVDANGTTTNVGRFAIRKVHGGTQQPGYTRAFYMNQPYGMKFYDAMQVWERDGVHNLACDMSFESGSSVDFCGGKDNRPLRLGYPTDGSNPTISTNILTIKGGGNCNLNLQLRTQQWEGNGPTDGQAAGVQVCAETYIQDNGQMKIYRSQTGAGTARAIEICRPITGQGSSASDARVVVELPYAAGGGGSAGSAGSAPSNGVNFDGSSTAFGPGCALIINGAGNYGLRVIGNNSYLDNLLGIGGGATVNRMESLSGTGGVLTIAATNTSGTMSLSSGPTNGNPGSVGLAFAGDVGHNYNLSAGTITNFSRLMVKSGLVTLNNGFVTANALQLLASEGAATVVVPDSASVAMGQLTLLGDATLQMGTAGGAAAVLNLANSSGSAWTAGKTLSITDWNGSAAGGGPDRVIVGTGATGLTAGQLAQIKWISPNGGGDVVGAKILTTGEIVPAVTTTIASPGKVGADYVFNVVPGLPGQKSVVQHATNLVAPIFWENVETNTGSFTYTNTFPLPAYYRVLVQ